MSEMTPGRMEDWRWQLGALVLLGVVAYAASFQVPFYFDDVLILTNPAFMGQQGLAAALHSVPARELTYSTLYANYILSGESPWGYHLFNLFCHLFTAAAILLLTRSLADTPTIGGLGAAEAGRYRIAAAVAAIAFALLPLNIQAVTYIVQRAAVLSALFYLLSIFAYLRARLAFSGGSRIQWFVACAVAGVCAMLSKQNAATLPLSLLMAELVFFPYNRKKLTKIGVGMLLALAAAVAVMLTTTGRFSLNSIDLATRVTTEISRPEYLALQTQVLWHYVRLFFIPLGLHLEYDPPASSSWGDYQVLLAAGAHLAVLGTAIYYARRHPLPAFGVLLFYTGHLVESSLIPIDDVVVEHRTYLSNAGLCMALGWLVEMLFARYRHRRAIVVLATGAVFAALLTLTVQRNLVWRDPVAFFEQNSRLAPNNVRAWGHLSTAYIDRKDYAAAYGALQKIDREKLNKLTREKYYANLVIALSGMDKPDEAIRVGRQVLENNVVTFPPLRAVMLNNLAVSYAALGYGEQALRSLEESLRLNPTDQSVIRNYAILKNAGIR